MAETQPRPAANRGRGSGRTGRGGHSSRGTRSGSHAIDADPQISQPSLEEQGEMGQLKKTYATELETLKELFPDWTDDELVLALEDTDGDLPRTIERISDGNVSQFSDVKKKTKDKTRAKKEVPTTSEGSTANARGRGRGGSESTRGGRGRGSDRVGRNRGGRGGSAATGDRTASAAISTPTTETTGWGAVVADATKSTEAWDQVAANPTDDTWGSKANAAAATPAEVLKSSLIPEGTKKSWASMLSTPKPVVVANRQENLAQDLISANEPIAGETQFQTDNGLQVVSGTPLVDGIPSELLDESTMSSQTSGLELAPPKDQLTEDNLEHLPDESQPIATETVASTRDASSVAGFGTPFATSQQNHEPARPPMGGYATSAWKATGTPGRTASFQKRLMEQREAVVMPSNHAVDRAAVQFGSMGLNGNNKPLDVDDDREETQTRAPVQQSPPSQPRASLPPLSHQQHAIAPDAHSGEASLTPRQASSMPLQSQAPPMPVGGSAAAYPNTQQGHGQYGRYGSGFSGQDAQSSGQKVYDPFAQQPSYGQGQDTPSMYPGTSQPASSQTHNTYSHGPNDYSAYSSEQQRYQNYYGQSYGQQHASSHQDQQNAQQRSGSAFGAESAYGTAQPPSNQSRLSETQPLSGHTTPNPTSTATQQMASNPQQVHHAQAQPQGQGNGGYPYGNPYNYGGNYTGGYGGGSYMNQYSNNNAYYGQHGYGAPYGNKGYGHGGQSYGMSPQSSEAFANNGRGTDSTNSGGLADYGRSTSTQPASQSSTSGSYPYGGDAYSRGASGYGQSYGQQGMDSYGAESKAGQPGRTGSAAGAAAYGQTQSTYQQQHSQGFGGYQNHLGQMHGGQGSGYGGGTGLAGGAQNHQASSYGGFSTNNNNYAPSRGGWSSQNYGGH